MPRLTIPDDATCLTPECNGTPTHILSVRMRRRDTSASWAPNLPAYFCDVCANSGCEMEIFYLPTKTRKNTITVVAGTLSGRAIRTTEVRQ